MHKGPVIFFPVSRRLTDPAVAPGPYVMQKGDVPRGAGLSVKVMDHVELEQKTPPSSLNSVGKGLMMPRDFRRPGGYGL